MSNARKLADNLPKEGQLGNRNVVINGELAISQRGTSFTNIGSNGVYDDTWTMDRFLISQGQSSGRCSVEQSSDTPDGFSKSLKVACTTANTNVGGAEYHRVQTKFEGKDLQRFAKGTSSAKEYTLSFHCKANAAATYVVELYDQDNQRTVAKTFSVTTNWTKVILTFPADTTGAFNNDNNLSMELNWWLHTGSTYGGGTLQTTWGSIVQANRAAGIDSFFDSTNRTFFITGVQLEVGSQASPFEHEPIATTVAKCERYHQRFIANGVYPYFTTGRNHSSTVSIFTMHYRTEMRSNPSMTVSDVGDIRIYDGYDRSMTGFTINGNSTTTCGINFTGLSSGAGNNYAAQAYFYDNVNGYVALDAEL